MGELFLRLRLSPPGPLSCWISSLDVEAASQTLWIPVPPRPRREHTQPHTMLPLKPLLPIVLARLPELRGADPVRRPLLPSGSGFQAATLHSLTGHFLPASGSEGQSGSQGSQGWNTACRAAAGSLPGSCPPTCPQALPRQAGASHLSSFPGKQKQEGSWRGIRGTEQGRGTWRGPPGGHGVLT